MKTDDEHLREKARLLLQRERELFDLRVKGEQLALWLSIGQELPKALLTRGGLGELWDRVRRTLIQKLRLQRVLLLEVHPERLRALAPAAADRPLPAEVHALVDAKPWGYCNDPASESNPAGVASLAEVLGLHRFMWSQIAMGEQAPVLLVAGFDRAKATFQAPFGEHDAAYFSNAARHLESLLANALLVEQLKAANDGLEHRVRERTEELGARNRELRLVLENVDQALLTVDLEGYLAPERSKVSDVWFGPYGERRAFVEHVGADPAFVLSFQLGLEALRDEFLPRELCIEQMPKRFAVRERQFECRYLPLDDDGNVAGLLLVIDDVTERVARAREDAEQRELLAAFTALMRDRTGFMAFFEEAQSMLSQLARGDLEEALEKRLLHTLKGNAASMGLKLIAEVCHGAESELAEEGAVREETHERLRARWAEIVKTMGAVIPAESRTAIEVSEGDLRTLHDLAGQGASGPDLVEAVERLRWEPVERHLTRLAQNAQSLAERLGKEGLEIVIDSGRLRLEPERWLPLWSSLMHVVRNAVDHGIEPSDEREHAGKPRRGCLRLEARRDERELRIAIHDDGRGIDWDAVRRACEEQGRPCGSRLELLNAILSPDFSTRRNVTETSGRGIGMAAIAAVTRELGGRLAVESETGEGTRWTLSFPSPVGVADASLDSARRAFHFAA